MFEKELSVPISLQQIEASLRRIAKDHSKRPLIEERLKIFRSGYHGEKNLNYFLSLLPEKNYRIFHNIRLSNGSSYFQIDFFLFSPKLGIILDSKHHSGTLIFEKNQLIHQSSDNEMVYPNPLSQVYRHQFLLKDFFENHQIPKFPIEYHVIVTNPTTKIVISPDYKEAGKRVWRADYLLEKFRIMEKTYTKDIFDKKVITKIKKVILQNNTPERIDFQKQFGINQSEFATGVLCPSCAATMDYIPRTWWKCSNCQSISKDAHFQAIQDYFLLFKPSINNLELRNFLHLPNARIARQILSLAHLSKSGTSKGRIYYPNSTNHVSKNNTNNK